MSTSRLCDYLDHMHQAAADACSFVQGMNEARFMQDKLTQQAVIMSLVIVGEAATRIMDDHPEIIQAHPEVPWRAMRGMRNRIAHGYFDINLQVVWQTVQAALPALQTQLPAVRRGAANPEDRAEGA